MSSLSSLDLRKPQPKPKPTKRRQYKARRWAGAETGNLYSDWQVSYLSANKEILSNLELLRARSRDLFQNNDYMAGYLKRIRTNMLNPHSLQEGMKLQCKIKNFDGKPDKIANDLIENSWQKFCLAKNCTVTKMITMADVIAIATQTMSRDGGCLIRKHRNFKNEFKFALQPLSIDYLDLSYNVQDKIIGGIEYDQWKAPIYYHLFAQNPGDSIQQKRIAVPADDIILLHLPQDFEQFFSVPWATSSLTRMRMLSGFEDSNAAGTRAAATKIGFFTEGEGTKYTGEGENDEDTSSEQDYITEAGPLGFTVLPNGTNFEKFDPGYPNLNFAEFGNHMLRGASCGVNSSYINFANDPGAANFASMRQSEVSEQDMWTDLQSFIIMHVLDDIYPDWLKMQLLTQKIALPLSKIDKFEAHSFIGKRWKSYKPVEDAKAKLLYRDAGIITDGDIIGELGGDHDDTMDRWAREQEKKAEVGYGKETEGTTGDADTESKPEAGKKPVITK